MTTPIPVYASNGITIYHARCEDVLPSIDPKTVGLLLTDPPYGVRERTERLSNGRSNATVSFDFAAIEGDHTPFDPSQLFRFSRLFLFGANHFADQLPPSTAWFVWDKREAGASDDNADCELAWTNLGGPARLFHHLWRGMIKASERTDKRVHPTQKPVALMVWIIEKWTKPGDLVVDPYMGSGPIAKACQLTGRRYIGCEIEAGYCDAAIQRLAQTAFTFTDAA